MADNKGTHPSNGHTSAVLDFPEVKDRIVERVEVFSDSEYYVITMRFQDKTTLTFIIEPCLVAFPVLADWTGREEKTLKKYKSVRSHIQRS